MFTITKVWSDLKLVLCLHFSTDFMRLSDTKNNLICWKLMIYLKSVMYIVSLFGVYFLKYLKY